jgi:ribosomal protein S18 acetylase RimI-like enzyme
MDFAALDNPIWSSLTSGHESFAQSHGLARRYPAEVSLFAALAAATPDAFEDLAALVRNGESVALFTPEEIDVPGGWHVVRSRWLDQMICTQVTEAPSPALMLLGPADAPDMLALTAATEPGPFRPQTYRMGNYFGVRGSDGSLLAMAGQRFHLDGFTEISAVCTRPEFRGRGFARGLVSTLALDILAQKRVPFLHVNPENPARLVYESVGFRLRRSIRVTVVAKAAGE